MTKSKAPKPVFPAIYLVTSLAFFSQSYASTLFYGQGHSGGLACSQGSDADCKSATSLAEQNALAACCADAAQDCAHPELSTCVVTSVSHDIDQGTCSGHIHTDYCDVTVVVTGN